MHQWSKTEEQQKAQDPAETAKHLRQSIEDVTDGSTENWDELVVETPSGTPGIIRNIQSVEIRISASPTQRVHLATHREEVTGVTIPDVLDAIRELDKPAVSTEEVASKVGCTDKVVQSILEELEDREKLQSSETGGSRIWWIDDEQDLLKGFGTLSGTDIPQKMREERKRAREESPDGYSLSR